MSEKSLVKFANKDRQQQTDECVPVRNCTYTRFKIPKISVKTGVNMEQGAVVEMKREWGLENKIPGKGNYRKG